MIIFLRALKGSQIHIIGEIINQSLSTKNLFIKSPEYLNNHFDSLENSKIEKYKMELKTIYENHELAIINTSILDVEPLIFSNNKLIYFSYDEDDLNIVAQNFFLTIQNNLELINEIIKRTNILFSENFKQYDSINDVDEILLCWMIKYVFFRSAYYYSTFKKELLNFGFEIKYKEFNRGLSENTLIEMFKYLKNEQ
jgi:hypothetical protein